MLRTNPKTLTPDQLAAVLADDLQNSQQPAEWRLYMAHNYLDGIFGPYAEQRCSSCGETQSRAAGMTGNWENPQQGFTWTCAECAPTPATPPTDTSATPQDAQSAATAQETDIFDQHANQGGGAA